jgi:hypothetical protein
MKLTRQQVLREWRRLVNMTLTEVSAWRANPRHKLASNTAGWSSLARIEQMLGTDPASWTDKDWAHAAKVVNFNARHLASTHLFGAEVGRSGWSKRAIALRNWGHDPAKVTSSAKQADAAWLAAHPGAQGRRQGR